MSLQGKRIALLESRLGEQLAALVKREGALPLQAPALAEVPDADPRRLGEFLDACKLRPPGLFIFQTGVGTRALFEGAQGLGRGTELLGVVAQARVVVRGPKPTAVLRGRQVRIDLATPDPHTTRELIGALESLALDGTQVVVQRYGESNVELESYLRGRGAQVSELPLYRWALPADTGPLLSLLDALEKDALDAVVFTSAAQVRNLIEFSRAQAREPALRGGLARVKVISIGPVCSRALEAAGVRVDGEPSPPKFGPLMALLRERV